MDPDSLSRMAEEHAGLRLTRAEAEELLGLLEAARAARAVLSPSELRPIRPAIQFQPRSGSDGPGAAP